MKILTSGMSISCALRVEELLNPVGSPLLTPKGGNSAQVDIRPQLAGLTAFSGGPKALHAPQAIQDPLNDVLECLNTKQHHRVPDKSLTLAASPASAASEAPIKRFDVQINCQTTLEILSGLHSGMTGNIVDWICWPLVSHGPERLAGSILNVAHSGGGHMGQTLSGSVAKCLLMVDTEVPSPQGKGSKTCPNSNEDELTTPHIKASREDVREQLRKDHEDQLQYVSPSRDIFRRTSAHLAALQKLGCTRPLAQVMNLSTTEEEAREARDIYLFQTQRGYRMQEGLCEGHVVFDYGDDGCPYISLNFLMVENSSNSMCDSGPASPAAHYHPPTLRTALFTTLSVVRSAAVHEKHVGDGDQEEPADAIGDNVIFATLSMLANLLDNSLTTCNLGSGLPRRHPRKARGVWASPLRGADELLPRADGQEDLPAPVKASDCTGAQTASRPMAKKRGISAKKERYLELKDVVSATTSLDGLATIMGEALTVMRLNKGAPIKAGYDLLDAIHKRLLNHHEFPCVDESRQSFSVMVTRAVLTLVKLLATQGEAQQRPYCHSRRLWSLSRTHPSLPLRTPPLPNPEDERMLVKFIGVVPSLLSLPYPTILSTLNDGLSLLGLPLLTNTQKQWEVGIFIVPKDKVDLRVLMERWSKWRPTLLPRGHIASVTMHCFLQVDGVSFVGAGTLEDMKIELEVRNPHLGSVVNLSWVNKPPSEAKAAAMTEAGWKPPKAGSLFVRLQSHDLVDEAIVRGRVILAGPAPAVGRGFPLLCIVMCWKCYKYGHTQDRCSSTVWGAAERATMASPALKSLSCKRIAEQLRLRAAALCKEHEAKSRFSTTKPLSATLSPLPSALDLTDLLPKPHHLTPRLPEPL
ncbi:hypothetical protein B0H17DRAFT_1151339 [Mycena rosella]|uniref:Uncharacterized protein n=1 Tax=Mycena rosella TaxID=1033263 RepID=A0AAD7BL84_MYCRO|nr:hypothetical protein B0H17DRAFT_1151339 [Mycena rosella]